MGYEYRFNQLRPLLYLHEKSERSGFSLLFSCTRVVENWSELPGKLLATPLGLRRILRRTREGPLIRLVNFVVEKTAAFLTTGDSYTRR